MPYLFEFCKMGRIHQYLASLSASSAVLALGVNTGWSSPYIPQLLSNSSSIPTTNTEASWCAVAPFLGCLMGAFLGANIVDRIGRKRSLLFLAPITFTSFVTMAFVNHIWYLTALRIIIGVTDGAIYTILPLYIGEIVDPEIREFLSSSVYYLFIVGTLLINIIGSFLDIPTSSLIACVLVATHFITFLFMPESPYHYVKIGKYTKAKNSLETLRGHTNVIEELDVLREVIEMEDQITTKPKFSDLFTIPTNRKACLIYFILMFVNKAACGKTPIMLYTKTIFEESGSTIDSTYSVIIYNVVELMVVILVTLFVTDKFGKRPLMIISASGCSLSILALAVYFYLRHQDSHYIIYMNWLPITSLVVHNISFSFGIGFGHMTYLSELFPMNVKANASFLAQFFAMVFGIAFAQFFQVLYFSFGIHIPFFCFALICGVCVIGIYNLVPETRGKSLEEIQNLLQESCYPVQQNMKG